MKKKKVSAVSEPTTVKVLQRFLGFANFYCRYIWGFSSVAALLPDLLKGKRAKHLLFTQEAQRTFVELKQC